jgi:4-amino-4-deoxy-L-arabinose transferase-like glycosyltransferase
LLAALVLSLHPFGWQFDVRLFTEGLSKPILLGLLLLLLERGPPTRRQTLAVGVLMGSLLLIRPTFAFLFLMIAVAWLVRMGWRRAAISTAAVAGVAVLMVVPWTIRNLTIENGGFVPISIQDGAVYGTFNDDAAHDKDLPWAWRPLPPSYLPQIEEYRKLPEPEFRTKLQDLAFDYIKEHPSSVVKAFYWNGLTRLWDVRHTRHAVFEAPFTGRSKTLTKWGHRFYLPILALAVAALVLMWRRRRRELVLALVAMAFAASLVHTIDSGTRYRAPMDPVIMILAAGLVTRSLAGPKREESVLPRA